MYIMTAAVTTVKKIPLNYTRRFPKGAFKNNITLKFIFSRENFLIDFFRIFLCGKTNKYLFLLSLPRNSQTIPKCSGKSDSNVVYISRTESKLQDRFFFAVLYFF